MPTNEERREVSENVSRLALTSEEVVDLYVLVKVLGLKKPVHYDVSTVSIESALRLSALIEPAKTGHGSLSGVCPKCGGSTYVVCDDYDWWVITCDVCGAVRGFNPGNYIPYGEIEREWKEDVNAD